MAGPKPDDEVLQMQLEHFGKLLRQATQARVVICTAAKKDAIQTSMHMTGYSSSREKAELMLEGIRALITTAGTALEEQTGGACKLLVMTPEGVSEALNASIERVMIERRGR